MTIGFKRGNLYFKYKGASGVVYDIPETHLVCQRENLALYYHDGSIHLNYYVGANRYHTNCYRTKYECDEPTDVVLLDRIYLFYNDRCVALSYQYLHEVKIKEVIFEKDNFPLQPNFAEINSVEILNGNQVYRICYDDWVDTDIDYITDKHTFKKNGKVVIVSVEYTLEKISELIWVIRHSLYKRPDVFLLIDGRYYFMPDYDEKVLVNLILDSDKFHFAIEEGRVRIKTKNELGFRIPPKPTRQVKSARNV